MKQNLKNYLSASSLLMLFIFGSSMVTAQIKIKSTKRTPPAPTVSKSEKEAIENIVREYLLKNPALIREALQALQEKEENERTLAAAKSLKTFESQIYSDVDAPQGGSKKGDVPIVVFYDYYCGYCRKSLPELQTLLAKDSTIKVIYKELPILGQKSELAALAALAANRQGKFSEFHQALLASTDKLDESGIREIAKNIGLDLKAFEKDMKDAKLSAAIDRNLELANALNINGTPAYIVGDQIVPGAIDAESLEKLLASQRAKLNKPAADSKNGGLK